MVNTIAMVCAASKTFLQSQFFRSPCDAKDLEKTIAKKTSFRLQKTESIYKR
jgi:hypothetical protein